MQEVREIELKRTGARVLAHIYRASVLAKNEGLQEQCGQKLTLFHLPPRMGMRRRRRRMRMTNNLPSTDSDDEMEMTGRTPTRDEVFALREKENVAQFCNFSHRVQGHVTIHKDYTQGDVTTH